MSEITLVTGGARSGKSALAEQLTKRFGAACIYVATAEPHDDEMRARIAEHQARRGPEWTTYLAPLDLVGTLKETDTGPRLVDCLTLWLSNLMLGEHDWREASASLVDCLKAQTSPVVIVTNEVGAGIVPDTALARRYRDAAGWLNQQVAAAADEVYLSVSGCPVRIKPSDTISNF